MNNILEKKVEKEFGIDQNFNEKKKLKLAV